MAYTFELTISGIMGVLRQNGGTRLRIVVPDTLMGNPAPDKDPPNQTRQAIDLTDLLRHNPKYKVGTGRPKPLRGRRLVFQFSGGTTDLMLPHDLHLPTMAGVLEGFDPDDCQMDPIFADPRAGAPVSAVLDIERGEVVPLTCGTAKLDTVSGAVGTPLSMAYALRWIVTGLDAPPSLRFEDLDGTTIGQPTDLPPDANNKAKIKLMSHRSHPGKDVDIQAVRDDDFRWFYEMLTTDAYHRARRALSGRPAPVPTQVELCPQTADFYPSTGGQLCRPCEFCGPD